MEDTGTAGGNGRRRLCGVDARPAASQPISCNLLVLNEVIEGTDGIGTAAYTGQHGVRKPSFLLQASAPLISLEITDWKSRTMVGKGCGPMQDPST